LFVHGDDLANTQIWLPALGTDSPDTNPGSPGQDDLFRHRGLAEAIERREFMLARLMVILLIAIPDLACGAEPAAEEYQVKGAFLLNFTKFVDWPPQVFQGPGDPIAICILGQNPFGSLLDRAARETVVANRTVSVRQVADGQQAGQCQIVFVGVSERKRLRAWLEALRGKSVLTVGSPKAFWRTAASSISSWRERGFA